MSMFCHSIPLGVCFATQRVAWEDFSHYSTNIGINFYHPVFAGICVILFFGGFLCVREVKQFDTLRAIRNLPHVVCFFSICVWSIVGVLAYTLLQYRGLFLTTTIFESISFFAFTMGMMTDVSEARDDPFLKQFNFKMLALLVYLVICPPLFIFLYLYTPFVLFVFWHVISFICLGLCVLCAIYLVIKLRSPVLGVVSLVMLAAFLLVGLSGRIGSNLLSLGSEAFATFEVFGVSLVILTLAFFLVSKFSAKLVLLYHTYGVVKLLDGTVARIIAKPGMDVPKKVRKAQGTKRKLKLDLRNIGEDDRSRYLLALYRQGRRQITSIDDAINDAEDVYSFPVLQGIREQIAMIPNLYSEIRRNKNKDNEIEIENGNNDNDNDNDNDNRRTEAAATTTIEIRISEELCADETERVEEPNTDFVINFNNDCDNGTISISPEEANDANKANNGENKEESNTNAANAENVVPNNPNNLNNVNANNANAHGNEDSSSDHDDEENLRRILSLHDIPNRSESSSSDYSYGNTINDPGFDYANELLDIDSSSDGTEHVPRSRVVVRRPSEEWYQLPQFAKLIERELGDMSYDKVPVSEDSDEFNDITQIV